MSLENLDGFGSDELLYLARLAEQAERYEEMIKFVSAFVKRESRDLSVEERNILSVAYKNVIGSRRSAWRILSSIEQKEDRKGNAENKEKAASYKREIEQELNDLSAEILSLIRDDLYPRADNAEAQVFYRKMEGDYHRYVCEYAQGSQKQDSADKAKGAYQEAYDTAGGLSAAHPIRLGLALNFSVFHYEILEDKESACTMAKESFDNAISELDNVGEENYKDSTLIMQLLRDNLTLWTSENDS